MHASARRVAVGLVTAALAVSLAGCGKAKQAAADEERRKARQEGPFTVALLLPENHIARYEKFDRPLIEKRVKELCPRCDVLYANAKADAATQQQQMNSMITKRVDVIILDPVDSKSIAGSVSRADRAGIPVVAYDRLAEGPISAYTSFDNVRVGQVQGEALLEALGDRAEDGKVVMMHGSPTDPNAAEFKKGAKSVLKGKVDIGREYDTTGWKPEEANKNMNGALASLGKRNIVGVYSANDGMAGGIITALKQAGYTELPPVTGQDAELAGVQRIIAGEQYMSVYKPYKKEAVAAAEMAVQLARGEEVKAETTVDSPTQKDVPATLIEPIALTLDNLKETVIKDGLHEVEDLCTKKYKKACEKAGLLD